jgi:aminoglycoside/choline kinase family phosphotransferase
VEPTNAGRIRLMHRQQAAGFALLDTDKGENTMARTKTIRITDLTDAQQDALNAAIAAPTIATMPTEEAAATEPCA